MRLVVKNSEGKMPFMGILYDSEKMAEADAKTIQLVDSKLCLHVNANYGRLFISLRDSNNKELKYYRAVEYDSKEYNLWRAYTHLGITFGHCYMNGDKLCLTRCNGNYNYLKIETFLHC